LLLKKHYSKNGISAMVPKILIVDDDPSTLRFIEKGLEHYTYFFSVRTAAGGQEALDIFAQEDFSLVISDLRMPGLDGFELINRIRRDYPDVPVMAMSAYDRPKTREVVMKSGAADYVIKPVDVKALFERVMKILKKQEEGGSLNNVSLETYLQLVEMEEQTCTLRIRKQSGRRMGILFFKKGQLMDARIGDRKGRDAAYKILSWTGVSLSIENGCIIKEKVIDGELQAILLNAMRSKDESDENEGTILEVGKTLHPLNEKTLASEKKIDFKLNKKSTEAGFHERGPAAREKRTPVESAEEKITSVMNGKGGIRDIYSDIKAGELISHVENIGHLFESGVLNVIYIARNDHESVLVVPDEENVVVLLDSDAPREGIIASFA
jgi:DNA-binding response OmpR family regulator